MDYEWKCHRSTDKVTLGITGLSPQESHIDGGLAPDVGSSHPGAEVRSGVVGPLKRYASWVQNVRQFGLICRSAGYLEEICPGVRETRVD